VAPILDGPSHHVGAVRWRVHGDEVRHPATEVASLVDDVGIPDPVHVAPPGEEADLRVVPTSVAVVADVQWLVKVPDQVDEEAKGNAAFLDRPGRVPEGRLELVDLLDDAALIGPQA
jgi:hypothetical protein